MYLRHTLGVARPFQALVDFQYFLQLANRAAGAQRAIPVGTMPRAHQTLQLLG